MKRLSILFITLFVAATTLSAKHVPKRVMYHYCTEVASAQYDVPLQQIDAQMPLYKKKGFVVHGTIRHGNGYRDKFSCRYDAYGKFEFIKKHTSRHTNGMHSRIKRVCKAEASVRWHIPQREIEVTDIRKTDRYHYRVSLESMDHTGYCETNRQGYVSKFHTRKKARHTPRAAKDACMLKAASRWNVPLAYISIDRSEYLGRGRYMIEVSSDDYSARCEVRNNGIIEHFNTRRITTRW